MGIDLTSYGFSWLADATVRASVPFALALVVAWGLSRRAARVRHATLAMAVFAALLFPAFSWLEPRWHMSVLPTPFTSPIETVQGNAREATPFAVQASVAQVTPVFPDGHVTLDPLVAKDLSREEPSEEGPFASTARSGAFPLGLTWRTGLLGLWAGGFLVGLGYLGLGIYRSRQVAKRASRNVDLEAAAIVMRLANELRLSRGVELIASPEVQTPMTFGWRRPVVLLPAQSSGWSSERKEVVLAHELVHVQRRDWLVQVLAQIARAFYWFHPLAWLAYKRMSIERERSCDEGVLSLGATPSVYARHLLDIAVGMQGRRENGTVLAMAHRTQLEGRLMSILENDRNRTRGHFWLAPVCLLMVGTSGALATTRTWAAPGQQEKQKLEEIQQEPKREPVDVPQANTKPEPHPNHGAHGQADPHAHSAQAHIERQTRFHHADPGADYSYFTLQRGAGKSPMKLNGHMWGIWDEDDLLKQPIWRNDERVRRIFEEARPLLEELRPYEEQLESIHQEMRPLHEQMEVIHQGMRSLHEHQEAIHQEMKPFHQRQDALHKEMGPFHQEVDKLRGKMEVYLKGQHEHHERLEPLHRRQEQLHREMEALHHQHERLQREIVPGRRALEKIHHQLRKLKEELATLTPENSRYGKLESEIDVAEKDLAIQQADIEKIKQHVSRVHDRLSPFHDKLSEIHKQMKPAQEIIEKLHHKLQPFNNEMTQFHERMEPIQEHLEHLQLEMEPFRQRLEEFHVALEPHHEKLQAVHEQMEPYHARMEPLHDAMKPIHAQLEPIWERMNEVLRKEVKAIWGEHVTQAVGFNDPAVRELLLDSRNELFGSVSWGWALRRDPQQIRLHAGWQSEDKELDRALKTLFSSRGWVLSEMDTEALDSVRLLFADTLSRIHYRL